LWDKVITQNESKLNPHYLGAREEKLVTISRSIYLPGNSDPVTIVIGQEEAPVDKTLEQLTNQVWVILSLMVGGILVLVIAQISWSLRPLGKMQKELKHLRNGERDLLDEHYPKEVAPLVTDLNALIFHYQELLERARNHAGNLSHALKTPLSVIRNELEHLSELDRKKIEPSLRQIQEYIDYHLGRARMAGSMNILSVKSCPSERVDAISIAFDKVFAERDIALINEIDPDLMIAIEQTDLDEMLGNLLENAYKWGQSLIRVHTNQSDNGLVEIIIEDDGPGIPENKLKEVLKRGVRLDETTPGTGLGLNIVNEMAYSYRSELTLESSKLGGLKATLIARVASD
jgi:signal transduction histidine kinase